MSRTSLSLTPASPTDGRACGSSRPGCGGQPQPHHFYPMPPPSTSPPSYVIPHAPLPHASPAPPPPQDTRWQGMRVVAAWMQWAPWWWHGHFHTYICPPDPMPPSPAFYPPPLLPLNTPDGRACGSSRPGMRGHGGGGICRPPYPCLPLPPLIIPYRPNPVVSITDGRSSRPSRAGCRGHGGGGSLGGGAGGGGAAQPADRSASLVFTACTSHPLSLYLSKIYMWIHVCAILCRVTGQQHCIQT